MRKKPIYILTDDLNFFYRVNKLLNNKKLNFKILNFWDKIPNIPSIILTTSQELDRITCKNELVDIIPYSPEENLEKYLFKVLAAYRLGYRDYEELTFSIDPGLNHIGLAVFLDGFYLNSQTVLEKKNFVNILILYEQSIQEDNSKNLNLIFKFGKGLIEISKNFIRDIFNFYRSERLQVYLIYEANSSKIRISYKGKKFPKHESSAIILAFRNGIEVNSDNYEKIFFQSKIKSERKASYSIENQKNSSNLAEIAEKVISGEISLKESYSLINNNLK